MDSQFLYLVSRVPGTWVCITTASPINTFLKEKAIHTPCLFSTGLSVLLLGTAKLLCVLDSRPSSPRICRLWAFRKLPSVPGNPKGLNCNGVRFYLLLIRILLISLSFLFHACRRFACSCLWCTTCLQGLWSLEGGAGYPQD